MKGYRRPTRCSFCSTVGHNRRGCELFKSSRNQIVEKYKIFRAKWWEAYKNLPYGYGTIYEHALGSYCHNEKGQWTRCEVNNQLTDTIVGIMLPSLINETGNLIVSAFSNIEDKSKHNYIELPFVKGYITEYSRRINSHGFTYCAFQEPFEKNILSFGATLAESVDRDKLKEWLEAEDLHKSYRFMDPSTSYDNHMDGYGLNTELVG
jgi:hypothetical protein